MIISVHASAHIQVADSAVIIHIAEQRIIRCAIVFYMDAGYRKPPSVKFAAEGIIAVADGRIAFRSAKVDIVFQRKIFITQIILGLRTIFRKVQKLLWRTD